MTQKTIRYGIAFDVDRVSLDRIQNQLQKIMQTPTSGMEKGFEKVQQTASEVYQILRQCYNQDLGTVNVEKFNAKLKQSGIGLKELQSLGPNTFNRMGMAMASANVQLNRSNTFINNIVKTFADSAKWSIAYGLINKVSQSVTDAISYVKDLDTSLNDIRIVTGKSEENMRSFAKEANKAAITLGSSTKAYADASLIYYQQGLGDAEAKERARITTMAANVTGQSASQVSEMLTAIWNGYKVNASEAELYIDKVAKVAAQTGADLEELATGMSKVASAANLMGVDVDELNAQLSTVITVTRQAPESVGTAFKTIYARINAIGSGSEDAETTLKQYTQTMLQYGIRVLDMNGKLRDTGDVIAEIGGKWGAMTKEQQLGLTQAMAGQRQYNNLLALFENWDMYNDALYESQNAMGTLQEQQDIYMDSIAAHAAQAKAEFEALYENILDKESINGFYDFTGNIAGTFDKMLGSFGGGLTSLLPILLTIGSLFSKQIASGAYNLFSTLSKTSPVIENIRSQMALISAGAQGATSASAEVRALAAGYQSQLDVLERMQAVRAGLNEQQQKEIVDGAARLGQLEEELALADSMIQKRAQELGTEGGVQNVNSVISQEEIAASYHSRQMGNSPEDDALGQKIQLRQQELALITQAEEIEAKILPIEQSQLEIEQNTANAKKTSNNIDRDAIKQAAEKLGIEVKERQHTTTIIKAIREKIQALKQSKQTTQEELAVLEAISAEMTETAGEFSRQRIEAEGVKGAIDNTLNSASKLSTVVNITTGALSSVGTAAMSWQMLSTSMDAFKEASEGAISWGDAITQALMSIGMGLPMALGAIKNLNETFGITTGIIDGYNARKMISNRLDQASIPLIGKKITDEQVWSALNFKSLAIEQSSLNTQQKKALADALENKNRTAALGILKGLNQEQLASLGLDEAEIASLRKLTAAQGAYNASAWANPWLIIGALVVAAVVGVTVALVKMNKAQETSSQKAEKRLKNEKEALEEMKSSLKSTQEQVKSLEESFTKYKSAINTLALCTKGTDDWKNALKEVNVAANELIDKYPQLKAMSQLWKLDDDLGTWVLDQSKIKELQDQLITAEQTQSFNVLQQEKDVANATLDAKRERFKESISQEYYNLVKHSQKGGRYGTEDIESIVGIYDDLGWKGQASETFPTIGSARDYAVFSPVEVEEKVKKAFSKENLKDILLDAYKEDTESTLKSPNNEFHTYEVTENETILKDIDSIWESVKTIQKAEEDNLIVQKNIEKQWLAENKDLTDPYLTGYDDVEKQAAETILYRENEKFQSDLEDGLTKLFNKGVNAKFTEEESQALIDAFGEDYLNKVNGDDGFTKEDKTGGELLETLVGLTNGKYSIPVEDAEGKTGDERNLVKGKDGDRVFYLSVDGENKNVSQETIYGYIAAQKAIEQLGESANKASSYLSKLSDLEGSDALFKLIAEGKIDNAKVSDVLAFQGQITDSDKDGKLTLDEYTAHFQSQDEDTQKALMASLGVDTIAEVAETIYKSIGQVAQYAGEGLSATAKQAFEEIFKGDALSADFTVKEQQRIGQLFQDIFNEFGEDGSNALTEIFEKASDDNKLAEALLDFDFSTGSLDDFKQALIDAGQITEDISDDKFEMLYKSMYDLGDAAYATAEMMANAAKLVRGDAISAEEYAKYAPFASEYFTKMHDGTYLLTGDAEEFYKLVKASRQQDFKDRIQESKDNINKMRTGVNGDASNRDKVNALFAAGLIDAAQKQEWLLELNNNKGQFVEDSTYKTDFETKIKQAGDFSKYIDAATVAIDDNQEALATTVETQGELNELVLQGWVSQENAAEGEEALRAKELKALGKTKQELNNYIALRKMEGVTAKALGVSETEYINLLEDEFIAKEKLQNAFGAIEDNFPKLYEALTSESATNSEKANAAYQLSNALKEAFGVDISSDFFYGPEGVKMLELFKLAINGDRDALQKLRYEAAKTTVVDLELDESEEQKIYNFIETIQSTPLELGQRVDITGLETTFAQIITKGGETAAVLEAIFNSLNLSIPTILDSKRIAGRGVDPKRYAEQVAKESGLELKDVYYYTDGELVTHVIAKPVATTSTPSYKPTGNGDKDTKTPDDIKPFKSEIDRYHNINREISSIQKTRKKLEKEAENLTGQTLIDNLKKQNELLDKQNAKIKEKISLLQKEALELKENLQLGVQINDETIKIQFDGDEISNYTEALTTAKNEVNELIQAYNAGKSTLTETQLKELKQKIDDAKEVYDLLVKMIERYEKVMFEEIPSAEEEIQENLDKSVDNAIEAFKAQIEIDLDFHDLQIKWREFQRTMTFDEDAFGSITKIAEDKLGDLEAYYGPGGIIEKLTNHVNSMVSGEGKGVYGDHTKDYLDDLKEYAEELMTNLEDAEEVIKEIREAVVELMEDASEAFDTQIERYEALQATLEHDIKLLDLIDGEENNYAAKQTFYDKQNENYIAQLAFQKEQIAFWQKQMEMAEEGTEAYETAEENMREAIESSQSTLEKAIEAAQTAHINSIRAIFEELENQITGGKGVSFLNDEWKLIKENADFYLDDVNEAYELSKLEANYRKAIDESSSLSAQKHINEMMNSELAMLKEKDKLTKYDIDRANLKYQLTLKQIALEDAQKNKSSMRLKRDASGNYSYQYVADSSATSQLEQEIADLNNQIHNLDKEALRSNLDAILQVWQEYKEALIAIEEQGGTEEEKAQKRYALQQQYAEKFGNLARENQWLLNTISADTIASITGNFNNGVQDMIDRIQGAGGFESVMEEAYNKIIERSHEYENTVHQMAAAVGTDLDDIYAGVDKNINILGNLIEKNNDVIYSYEQEMNAMWQVISVLDAMIGKYAATKQAAMDAASAAVSAYQTIAMAGTANNSTYSDDTDWARAAAQELVKGNIYSDELTHRTTKINSLGGFDGYDNDRIEKILSYYNIDDDVKNWVDDVARGKAFFTDDWQREYLGTLRFNTGGYTGEWANGDNDGRLALLHQKELVLNAKDTANLLSAVDIVRMLDTNLLSRVAGMLGSLGMTAVSASSSSNQPIEQNVHIDAHFPNVSSAQEIQEAFDQLATEIGQLLYNNTK